MNILSNKRFDLYIIICLVLLALIYVYSSAKDPSLGDSLPFTIQAYHGFVFESNATNHFLYSNFLSLIYKILPFHNVHSVCVGISIISSVLSLYFLNKLLSIVGISRRSSFICLLLFGFSFTFWRMSVITEVYTFYLVFVILFLINIFKFLQERKPLYFYYLSIIFGILFLIHIQSILFIPIYFYLIFKNYKILKEHIIYGGLILIIIFSILLIPVALGYHSLLSIFTDNAYQDSIFNFNIKIIFKSIIRNIGFLLYNFLFFVFFLFLGLRNKERIDYIAVGITPFLFFCIKHNVSDIYVFHLVPYVFLLIFIGRGMDYFPRKIYFFLPFLLPLIYFAAFKITEQTKVGEDIGKEKGFKGGVRYMMFPPLNKNPDLSYFIKKYKEDSLYKKPELKYLYPYAVEWENIKNKK